MEINIKPPVVPIKVVAPVYSTKPIPIAPTGRRSQQIIMFRSTEPQGVNPTKPFGATLYSGDGTAQHVETGVDLSNGGLTILRETGEFQYKEWGWYDHLRGTTMHISSANSYPQAVSTDVVPSGTGINLSGDPYFNDGDFVAYSFAKIPGLLDVIRYTGDGTTRVIPHALGCQAGMVLIKPIEQEFLWNVSHRSVPGQSTFWGYKDENQFFNYLYSAYDLTDQSFSVNGDTDTNFSGWEYIAYVFAHDPAGQIACDSVALSGETQVALGWQPQWVMLYDPDNPNHFELFDAARGFGTSALYPETDIPPVTYSPAPVTATPTGFTITSGYKSPATRLVYMAVRS